MLARSWGPGPSQGDLERAVGETGMEQGKERDIKEGQAGHG